MGCQKSLFIRKLVRIMFIMAGCMSFSQASAGEKCPMEVYQQAESSLIKMRDTWTSLVMHRKMFAGCDDGALGEGYSDAVVVFFANKWEQFPSFVALSQEHRDFQEWAIRHVDATASNEDLKKILIHSASCPDDEKKKVLCQTIRQRAKDALAELDKIK